MCEELFEARAPKKAAIMTERAGVAYVHQDPDMPGVSDVFIHDEETNAELAKYAIPYGMRRLLRPARMCRSVSP